MGFDFSSENLSSQIPILSDKVYVSDFCVSNMDSHVIVSLVLSLNVLAVPEPRKRLREGRRPEAGHGRVSRWWPGLRSEETAGGLK